jgi:hypothetical protein
MSIDATADRVRDIAALLRAAATWHLTDEQATDLDHIVTDLEQALQSNGADLGALARVNGDLKVLESTVRKSGSPISREQRDRIKRVILELDPSRLLGPGRRRGLLRMRP